jgi:hypothetical protein
MLCWLMFFPQSIKREVWMEGWCAYMHVFLFCVFLPTASECWKSESLWSLQTEIPELYNSKKKKKFKHVFLNVPMRTTHNSTTKNNNSMLHLNSVLSKVVALVLKVSTSNIDIFYRKQTRGAEQLVLKCIAEFLQICRHLSLFYCVRGYSFWATKAWSKM